MHRTRIRALPFLLWYIWSRLECQTNNRHLCKQLFGLGFSQYVFLQVPSCSFQNQTRNAATVLFRFTFCWNGSNVGRIFCLERNSINRHRVFACISLSDAREKLPWL